MDKTEKELIEEHDKLLQELPEEFRSAIAYHAYEQGHAYGQNEINIHLKDLVSALKEPIKKFQERIIQENQINPDEIDDAGFELEEK